MRQPGSRGREDRHRRGAGRHRRDDSCDTAVENHSPVIVRLPRTRRGAFRQGQVLRGVYGTLWEDIAEYLNNLNFVTKGYRK